MKQLKTFFYRFAVLEQRACTMGLRLDDIMVLIYMGENGVCSAGALSNTLCVSKPRISRCLARLEAHSIVRNMVYRSDYRVLQYRLSNRGENIYFELGKEQGKTALHTLLKTYCALQEATRKAEQAYGIRKISDSAQRIYTILAICKKPVSVSFLCEYSSLAQNRLSQALKVLEQEGILVFERDEADRRIHLVTLTLQGREIVIVFKNIKNEI